MNASLHHNSTAPRLILAAGALVSALSWPVAAPCAERASKPNIVLIVADDLGYQDIGCYDAQLLAPHLDQLAKEGVRLTQFYVTWPACTPSRGSILTGRYPQRNGLYEMIRNDMVNYGHRYTEAEYTISPEMTLGMDVREVMISQPLHAAGYATGAVGKWDGGRAKRFLPLARGFDFFYGFANTGIDYWTHQRYGIPSLFRDNERIEEEGYATDLFGREAIRFVREHRDRPFFLYLPFNAPHGASNLEHDSYQAPAETISRYTNSNPADKNTVFRAMITRMDDWIGQLLSTLREMGVEDNTLVIFTSDNGRRGPGKQALLRGGKGDMFEGGLRVPFIARWPKRLPAGVVSEEFLSTLELFPTFVAVAGAEKPQGVVLDGFDMLPVLSGIEKSPRAKMFWQSSSGKAAHVGQYKWVESSKGDGLFDLKADLKEEHDLSTEKPQLLAELRAAWANWRREMDEAEPRGPFRDY